MSYYENNGQWGSPAQNNWDHQAPSIRTGATGPTSQDEFAFSYQFDEVERAHENLSKGGKAYGMTGRHGRGPAASSSRGHSLNDFGDSRGHAQSNLQNFYASQRHQPSRGSNEAEQVMQAKRRMAAQRERELRNLHTEQQFQRTALNDVSYGPKAMSEEETRDLIARQRSALYGEGSFGEKGGYVDETGNVRPGAPAHSGPASLRGASPMGYDLGRSNLPAGTDPSGNDGSQGQNTAHDQGSRPNSTVSPQPNTSGSKGVFDGSVPANANRTSSTSPGGSPPRQELPAGTKPNQPNATVAPIGTRPSAAPAVSSASKRSTTPLASPGGWGRGNGVWGQSSGLGAQASVWG